MDEAHRTPEVAPDAEVVELNASRFCRINPIVGGALALAQVGLQAYIVAERGFATMYGLLLVAGALQLLIWVWSGILFWGPVIRLTADAVETRAGTGLGWWKIPLDDVVGLRSQDSFDLRLCTRSGTEHSIRVGGSLRERFEALLRERIAARTTVAG
jgi:hypothetical protein